MKSLKNQIRPTKCQDCMWGTGNVCAFHRCVRKNERFAQSFREPRMA